MKIKNLKDNVLNQIMLLVIKVEFKVSKKQEDYAKVIFSDGKTQINSFIWNIDKTKFNIKVGSVYDVFAYAQEFNSKPILKIVEINLNDDPQILNEFVRTAVISTNEIKLFIDGKIGEIKNQTLQNITREIVASESEYYLVPAAANNHHAYLTGMSYHVYNMLKLVDLFDLDEEDKDILTSAIILHDIGKCVELKNDLVISYTTKGYLLGHLAIGYEIIFNYLRQEQISNEQTNKLLNLILAHHGKIEYGNLKKCSSKLEKIINLIDTIDAYLNAFIEKLESIGENTWSDNVYALNNRKVYKQPKLTLIKNFGETKDPKLEQLTNIYLQRYENISVELVQLGYLYTREAFPKSYNNLLCDVDLFKENEIFYDSLKHLIISDISIDDVQPLAGKIIEAEILKWFKVINELNSK